jgi:hypothetical protein
VQDPDTLVSGDTMLEIYAGCNKLSERCDTTAAEDHADGAGTPSDQAAAAPQANGEQNGFAPPPLN